MISRRSITQAIVLGATYRLLPAVAQGETFDAEFEKVRSDDLLLANVQEFGRRDQEIIQSRGTVHTRQRSDRKISKKAIDLIIVFEVSGPTTYQAKYQGVIKPGGASGITCGIGYDVGYVTKDYLKEDWTGYISDDDIRALSIACGVTGTAALPLKQKLSQIKIPYAVAEKQFLERALPFYVAATLGKLPPPASELSDSSLGALVSLVYNRGPSFRLPGDRYAEMRQISKLIARRQFAEIPAQLSGMAHLWTTPDVIGVARRRKLEALLFAEGLT